MATATMTSKGQMTVPKSIRERLRIGAGDRIQFVVNEQGEVVVRPARGDVTSLRGLLAVPRSRKAVSVEAMNDAILASHSSRR
jgi:AbrB family looped-hinge helix DNA binding protein